MCRFFNRLFGRLGVDSAIFLFAWFLAGFVNGVSGLGAAMVAVTFTTFFMPTSVLIPVTCIIAIFVSGHMSWIFRAGCRRRSLTLLLLGALPGSLIGLSILLFIPAQVVQFLTGCVMVFFVMWQYSKKIQPTARPETVSKSIFAGFASGVLNTSISFGNPPIGAYALHLGWSQMETVGTMNMFSFLAYIVACAVQASAGLYTQEVLVWAAMGIPAALVGILCSMPVAQRINAVVFKNILLVVIAVGGMACVWRSSF